MRLRFFNTLGRSLEDFEPRNTDKVGFYACGPTVYNYAHIGNLRTYVFEDILRRVLNYAGYAVEHVMNITDVGHLTDDADEGEDKMEKSSREQGKSVWDIARYYTDAFFRDTDSLNILRPTLTCTATEHVGEMIELIKRIEENGYTYLSGGNLYFSIDKVDDYGRLALLDREGLKAGARISVDNQKKNPHDFVLWFTKSKFEHQSMMWDSPWGRGYPGWHIECSAMSMKYLGEQFDIHCGGIDHIPVHHTNEIAQSEAATGKKPWVKYWIHGEFLLMNTEKMAKSAGNFITLQSLIEEGFTPLDYRYFCLGGHYRSQLIFSWESLDAARTARHNLEERVKRLMESGNPAERNKLSREAERYLVAFEDHIAEDLAVPRGLADMWSLLKDDAVSDREKLCVVLQMDRILGFGLDQLRVEEEDLPEDLSKLIQEREDARKNKNFARADEIRDILENKGIELRDTPEGTRWKRMV